MESPAPHVSVMPDEVVQFVREKVMAERADGRPRMVMDGTVGQGGHSRLILESTPAFVRVCGTDRDPQAVGASAALLAGHGERFSSFHFGYDEAAARFAALGIGPFDVVLLDLGLSSTQLGSDRGFSFSAGDEQPLDMRFDVTSGPTATEVIMTTPTAILADAFRELAQVPMAGRLARILKEEAGAGRMATVGQLVDVCHRIYGPRIRKISSPTLPMQALRMMVNQELQRLRAFYASLADLLVPGGRLVTISFHSGEDTICKHVSRQMASAGGWALPFRKAMVPSEAECMVNARSRSAKLRVLDRLEQ
ncbi:MAG TPA: 16S rRNA (cytosine(1402)-N(4))-methyltransferase RsmH [Myxococcota bacterium]|nr:16S rRNA (cytosine(1402)-N(4))-methyltransferase RsmH [Myxococcota bacterium]